MSENASEALAALREQFRSQLEARVQTIRDAFDRLNPAAWNEDEAKALHRLVHGLTGSAGTFGMNSISDVSRQLEHALSAVLDVGQAPAAVSWETAAQVLARLEGVVNVRLKSNAPSLAAKPDARPQPQRSPLIHLVEDDPGQAEYFRQCLVKHGFRVRHFAELADFNAVITAKTDEPPGAVVMDMVFPEGGSAGVNIVAKLGLGADSGTPVVFVSVRNEISARLAAYRTGASRYLAKPVDPEQLCALLDDVTGRMPSEPFRVLLVDDDKAVLAYQAAVLQNAGMEVLTISEPLQCLDKLHSFAPDVVVLDVYMPDASGPELAAVIREQPRHMNLPILFLSAEQDMSRQLLALNLGGDDFLVKPVKPEHLVSAVIARARRARQNTETMQRLRLNLYEREREHQALNQHALVSVADAAGRITYANEAFCRVSGYAIEELLGQNHSLLKSGRHSPEFYRDMWTTLKSGNIWRGEICNRAKNDSYYWVGATITPFLDGDGKVYQYVSIRSDITVLKESQETLRLAKERLRRGQIYANIGTWEWNVQTNELYWSERIAPLFGHPEGELETSYENFINAVHPDDRQAVIDAVNACVSGNAPYEIEHRVVWPDGQVRWLLERGAVMLDEAGKALQMLGVVQDIDDRKRAELNLLERERLLREAQTLARIGNWSADLVTGKLVWSDEIYRIFGHEPGSFAPSVAAFHATVHPDDRELVRESEMRAEHSGRHDVVHRIVRPNGEVRYVHELAQMHLDTAGKPVALTGTVQDVTERMMVERELVAAREEADRANQAKSEFLSSMSHELRTPMNAILGFGQIMEFDTTLPADHKDSVHEILKAGRHLLELINEVLDLAKVESGHIDLSLEPVEVFPLVLECISLVTPLAGKRDIRMDHAGLDGAVARADRTRLRQVLLNLLSNAVKYNREGGSVRVEVRPEGERRLRIMVTDTGPGIATERLTELFQPFNRLGAEATAVEGTGIGLTITRRIVEMMGGTVDVESEVGVGSTFWIELPLEDPIAAIDGAEPKVGAGDTPAAAVEAVEKQHTVLYIEDNPSNIALMSQALGRRPHIRLLTAHAPRLGLELAVSQHPDLILLDINMPDMDGYAVLAELKANDALKDIAIIAITANAMPRDIEHGIAAGFSDYLTKPLDILRLYEVLDRRLLERA